MTRKPLVSVIVPSFNYGHFLPATLESVRRQTWDAWECIVVDDGSTDDTSEVALAHAQRDPRIKYVYRANGGLAAARNTGLRAATGDYVQFLDADDALEPRKLEAQVGLLERERDVGIVYGDARYFDSESGARRRGLFSDEPWMPEVSGSGEAIVRALLRANIMVVNAALVRRAVIDEVGWFDETLRSLEDWDYWIRCALAGTTFRFLSDADALALVRVHPRSMSQNRLTMHEQQSKVRQRMDRASLGKELYWVNRFWFAAELAQLGAELGARGDSRGAVRAYTKAALTHPRSRGLEGVQGAVRAFVPARTRQWLHRARQRTRTNTRWPDDRPLVSVVIPCFNYGAYVETAIDSVLAQTWKDLEIIVVDGGSTDGTTVERLRALDKPKTTVHFRSGRHLVGDNRNFGIGLARGKYICCLDADDLLAPTYLEKAVFVAEAYAYDLVFPSVRCFGGKNDLWMVVDPTVESCRDGNGVSTVGLFRRSAWEKIGGYRDWGLGAEHVPEDWDFWLRLLGHGFRAKSLREPLMYYRVHGHGLTGTATMDVKAQAAKIDEANQRLRSPRLRMTRALVRKMSYVVENPTVNLCRVRDATPRTLVARGVAGRDDLDALSERFAAPDRALTIVTTADSPTDAPDESLAHQPTGTEVFRLPWFLDEAARRDRFLLYLLESRAVDTLVIDGSDEARRLLPEIRARFPNLRIT